MADVKISELPIATAISSPDVAPIVQGGVTKQANVSLFGGSVNATTAFVRPAPIGNNSTGSVGGKPFLTVQGAINAVAVLVAGNDPPNVVVIDIDVNSFTESLMLDNSTGTWPLLIFKGVTNSGNSDNKASQSISFSLLSITGNGNQLDIRVKDCACGQIFTDSPLVVIYDNGNSNGNQIVSTHNGGNGLTIGSMYGGGNGFPGAITANDTDILLFGITSDAPASTPVNSANGDVTIANCGQAPEGTIFGSYTPSYFSVNAPNGNLTVNDSLLKNVTCGSINAIRTTIDTVVTTFAINLRDSRIGANSSGITPTITDVLLNPAGTDFSTLPQRTDDSGLSSGQGWIDTTAGLNIIKVKL